MAISKIDGVSQSASGQMASAAVASAPLTGSATVVPVGVSTSVGGQTSETLTPAAGTSSELAVKNDKEHVEFVSKAMNHFMQLMNADLQFSVHEKTHRVMVKLVDDSTKEVLKEIPSEEFLDMVAKIQEYVGMLVDKEA